MGQHKHNPTVIKAKNGEIKPKANKDKEACCNCEKSERVNGVLYCTVNGKIIMPRFADMCLCRGKLKKGRCSMRTNWKNVILESEAKRGYGECVRLWDNQTGKAIDFGRAENEYQDSVHPIDGEYDRIKELLDTQTQKVRQTILDICGEHSCCSLYRLWSYDTLRKIINGIAEPLPIDKIKSLYNKLINGDINARKELKETFYYILREGYDTIDGIFHKFSAVYKNSSVENICTADGEGFRAVKLMRYFYPNESDLIEATKCYALRQL